MKLSAPAYPVLGIGSTWWSADMGERRTYESEFMFLPRQKCFLHNPLLVHPVLGRSRRPTSKLPKTDFTFGQPGDVHAESAKAVLFEWKMHKSNPLSIPGPDFVRLNIASVDEGALTSHQITEFRRTHDIRLRHGLRHDPDRKSLMPAHLKGKTFGKSCKSTEPTDFAGIINNKAYHVWIEGQRRRAQERNSRVRTTSPTGVKGRTTRSETLRQESRKQQEAMIKSRSEASLWKIKQYSGVPARVTIPFSPSRARFLREQDAAAASDVPETPVK